MEPEQPEPPVVSVNGDNVLIDWEAPYDSGSPIQGYEIYVRQDNLIYSIEPVNCDGGQEQISIATQCEIPISTLIITPYSLSWGSNVYA